MYLHNWGLRVGHLYVTWWDLWARRPCWEVLWEPYTDCWDRWEREVRRVR